MRKLIITTILITTTIAACGDSPEPKPAPDKIEYMTCRAALCDANTPTEECIMVCELNDNNK